MPNWLLHNYATRGFWGDEAWTALISQFSIPNIIRVTSQDFHPPMYYFFVHGWGQIFNFSELAIRSLSIIFFLLAIITFYLLTKHVFKKTLSRLISTLLVTLSPILLTYALESRAYALLSFLSILSGLTFWRARTEKGNTWKITYFLVGAVSVYTHYYAWFILASHAIYLLLFERKRIKKLLIPALGILAVQLPWIPVLFSQIGEVNNDYWIAPISKRTHWEFFYRTVSGDLDTKLQIPLAIIFAVIILTGLIFHLTKSRILNPESKLRQKRSAPIYRFLWIWLLIPTLIPTLISLKMPIFFYRYLIFSAIPIILLLVKSLGDLANLFILFVAGAYGGFQAWFSGKSESEKRVSKMAFLLGKRTSGPLKHKSVKIFNIILFAFALPFIYSYLKIDLKLLSQYPNSFKQEKEKISQQIQTENNLYTYLPSFAEVMYYFKDTHQIKVIPEGLVQFSGKSLLDAFVEKGEVEITQPKTDSYWLLEPGPKSKQILPAGR